MNIPDIPGAPVEVLVFVLFALGAIAGAVAVVSARDPFWSALALLVNFGSLGVLYLLLHAPFVAMAQVLVYVSAVVVLFLFVIAYLGDRRELAKSPQPVKHLTLFAFAAGTALLVVVGGVTLVAELPEAATVGEAFGGPAAIGEAFLTTYVLQFEATSLVLLVAAVGGIVLGLTGRSRSRRMRSMMGYRSADSQRDVIAQARGRVTAHQHIHDEEPVG
jgi:NADH-quinone oxidoreductase subunit J